MLCPMPDLYSPPWIDLEEFGLWCQKTIPANDPRALLVLRATAVLINSKAGRDGSVEAPLWTSETAPDRVKLIYAQVAKRNYLNANQVIREGNIGPIGGDTYVAAFAAGMELTEYETAEIQELSGEVSAGGGGELNILTFSTGRGRGAQTAWFLGGVQPGADPVLMFTAAGEPYYFPVIGDPATTAG